MCGNLEVGATISRRAGEAEILARCWGRRNGGWVDQGWGWGVRWGGGGGGGGGRVWRSAGVGVRWLVSMGAGGGQRVGYSARALLTRFRNREMNQDP